MVSYVVCVLILCMEVLDHNEKLCFLTILIRIFIEEFLYNSQFCTIFPELLLKHFISHTAPQAIL